MGGQIIAAAEQVGRQAAHLADAEDTALRERGRVLGRFLSLGDSLGQAMATYAASSPGSPAGPEAAEAGPAPARDTLERIRAHYLRILDDLGCRPLAGPGAPFDPRVHRAVSRVHAPELAGRVAQVVHGGWTLDGRLLRPADVVVAVAEAGPEAGDTGDGRDGEPGEASGAKGPDDTTGGCSR